MPLDVPNLDDRSYDELREAALERIQKNLNTDWNDLSPGDPGIVLLEAFAFLTEQLLYRLNRLPDKAFIAFLRMLGVSLHPPTAARAPVVFWLEQPSDQPTIIPKGTQIRSSQAEDSDLASVFVTDKDLEIPANVSGEASQVDAFAYHCDYIVGELVLAESTGQPGQTLQIRRPPIVAKMNNNLDITVGVSVPSQPAGQWIEHEGKIFHIWEEVENFANLQNKQNVFTVDREKGIIQFAPAVRLTKMILPTDKTELPAGVSRADKPAGLGESEPPQSDSTESVSKVPRENGLAPQYTYLGAIPPVGSEIRVWYARGGGESGNNLPEKSLDTPLLINPAIRVENTQRSHSGLSAESIKNAMIRGPQEVYALERAVTAEDFERVALSYTSALARAKAFDKAGLWAFAAPGVVTIVMVPRIPDLQPADLSAELLKRYQQESALRSLHHELEARKTLGTRVEKQWARYKKVTVSATLTVRHQEDRTKVSQRIAERIQAFLSPLPLLAPQLSVTQERKKDPRQQYIDHLYEDVRPFGQAVRVSEIYQLILDTEERQIGQNNTLQTTITSVEVEVESAPDHNVHALAADHFQPHTWYAGSGNRFFRSTNDGIGWEQMLILQRGAEVLTQDLASLSRRGAPLADDETIIQIETSPYHPGLLAMVSRVGTGQKFDSYIYLSATCGEIWIKSAVVHCKVEDMAWIKWPSGNFLLLATQDGLLSLAVAFSDDGAPQILMAPELIPVFMRESSYPLYAVTVIEGVRGNLVAVAARGRRGVYLATSSDLLTPKQAAAMMPAWHSGAEDNHLDLERAVARAELDPLEETGAGGRSRVVESDKLNGALRDAASSHDPFPTSPYFRYIGCVNEDIRHLSVQQVGNRLHLWAGVMAKADRGKGCYRWSFDPNPTLIDSKQGWVGDGPAGKPSTWTGGSCYALAFQRNMVFAITAWGGVLRLVLDETLPLAEQKWIPIERENLPIRSYELAATHETSLHEGAPGGSVSDQEISLEIGTDSHIHLFLPLVAIASNNLTKSSNHPMLMVGGEQGVYLSKKAADDPFELGEHYENASRTVFKMLKDTITIPKDWLIVPGEPKITIISALEIAQADIGNVGSGA